MKYGVRFFVAWCITLAGASAGAQTAPVVAMGSVATANGAAGAAENDPHRIVSPPATELAVLRPLANRGAAALVYFPDGGPLARTTVVVPVNAAPDVVRGVIVDAARWPEFMPALTRVETLGHYGRRGAYRFDVAASLLHVSATTSLREVSNQRVDFSVSESEFGPAGARWEVIPDGVGRTLLVITSWSDPTLGHWLLRDAARSNASATAGMNVAVDLTLALSVARRARALSGEAIPIRPEHVTAPAQTLSPPPEGAWVDLLHRYYTLAFDLTPDGAVSQISVSGQSWGSLRNLTERLHDVAGYSRHLPGVRESAWQGDEARNARRASLVISSPFESGSGTVQTRHDDHGTVWIDGDGDALSHIHLRWDVHRDPTHGVILTLTGQVEEPLAGLVLRAAASREPFLYPGVAALRELVWLRYALAGIGFD